MEDKQKYFFEFLEKTGSAIVSMPIGQHRLHLVQLVS